ncbi:MAG TPA: phosphoesterase, partial [Chloroflexia bacterium]|nr:phosphoesterase [Chloroflexia bacterium]
MQRTNDRAEQRAILTITLTPGDHGRFVEAPFEVPAGTERVSVSCEVQGYEFAGQVVDLGLVDQAGSRGWSGGARAEFWIERDRATPGYLPGELRPGRWAVRVASNRVPPDGCAVTLTVTCTPEKYRWLRGDLHLHSVHSDGRYELPEVLRLSEAAGL